MLSNLQMEGSNNGGSEQAGSSDDGQLVAALRQMMRKEVEVMVISTVQKVIVPVMEKLIRKVVKEEIQSAQKKFQHCGDRNDAHEINMSTERRSLQFKFLDEVSLPVLTGKEIKGKGGTAMRLAVVDKTTGQVVTSGPEASAKVEIVVLQTNNEDNEHDWSVADFNNRIIRENDKKKPHFAKGVYVYLKEGIGFLCNVKLGHDSSWMKSCECRLGARVVDNVGGSTVKEGWTESFVVQDSRSKLYEKHYPPFLSDDVWRLENIGKDGAPCKRLNKENICKVRDFLFLLSIDPQRLQKMVGAGPKMWKATVDHARKCIIDDKKIYLYSSPSEMVVVFDAVGQLMGIVHDSHYFPLDNLSEVEKASAHELLLLAFDNRKDITSINDEESLLNQFPYKSNYVCAAKNSSTLESSQGCHLTVSECIDEYDATETGTLSQTIDPPISHSNNFDMLGSENAQHLCDISSPVHDQGPSSSLTSLGPDQGSSCPFTDLYSFFGSFDDNECLMSLLIPCDANLSETLGSEPRSDQQSNGGSIRLSVAAALVLWLFRLRKRVMGFGETQVQKRQRIG